MARKKSAARKAREEETKKINGDDSTLNTKKILDLNASDEENKLIINEEYASRFEHNKKREEIDRLKEKYKDIEIDQGSQSSSSEDEDEDDFGELLTEEVDQGINDVLKAIRENPQDLLNNNKRFFENNAENIIVKGLKKEKPVLLKDYHRQNYLEGQIDLDENDKQDLTYADRKKNEHKDLIAEINKDPEEKEVDDEDDFLIKRKVQREVDTVEFPDSSNETAFLEAYLNNKAWIPKGVDKITGETAVPTYGEIVGDENEDDEEFDEIADKFENAYNFRFEDPNAAEIVSYARSQITMRRDQQNSRKRLREKKKEEKQLQNKKRKDEITKLKRVKVKQVASKFEKLKQIIGDDDLASKFSEKDLEADFDDTEWDKKMMAVFNEEFYSKHDTKPEWDASDHELEDDKDDDANKDSEPSKQGVTSPFENKSENRSKRDKKKNLRAEKRQILDKAEEFVEKNIDLAIEEANIRENNELPTFRYREVSPDAYGLTARDILLANDKDLNEYVGLKKLAPFRDGDKKLRDRKKYAKKRRLREWRKTVFDREDEPDEETFVNGIAEVEADQPKKKRRKNV